ncbi:MAG TPA: hypothetical protein VJ975_01815 [Candidatus Limnocylindria bacterium]|nr:hypothetical protein [Candidatus Limnocylindria bacterium]
MTAALLVAGLVMPAAVEGALPSWAPAPVDLSPVRAVTGQPAADDPIGYDISFPQCGGRFPSEPAFAIVGVTGGRAFTDNPCLGAGAGASQLEWAGPDAGLYLNTGNPGPELSKAPWPSGQLVPAFCDPEQPESAECAYDYGWNAAAHAYQAAIDAYVSLGWAEAGAEATPVANWWWLDVEIGNSWSDETELNVASIQGSIDYLETREVAGIGIYSVGPMWEAITGGTDAFVDHPNWVAGATTINGARRTCIGAGFSGGPVLLTQYTHDGFDANHRC